MCKLLIITGALRMENLIRALAEANRAFAKTEKDGFGFIAVANGNYARGRYLEPSNFRRFNSGLPHFLTGDIAEENHLPAVTQTLIVHGRTATSTTNLRNCHPFMRGHEALAHNGVVSWLGSEASEPPHECDSEQFFAWLHGRSWHDAKHAFAGWGAIAHVDIQTGILTVARDRAMLYCAKRKDNKGWVMATKADTLLAVCKAARIRLQHAPLLLPNHKLLLFSKRGAVTSVEDWDGFGQRQLTYFDEQSWGSNEGLHENTGKKRECDRRGARRRQEYRGHPSFWERSDSPERYGY